MSFKNRKAFSLYSWSFSSVGISWSTMERISRRGLELLPVKIRLLWPQATGKQAIYGRRRITSRYIEAKKSDGLFPPTFNQIFPRLSLIS